MISSNFTLIAEAGYLAFIFKSNSIESNSFISSLAGGVKPNTGRRKKHSDQFISALGSMVAALLKQASIQRDGYLFRSMARDSFTDHRITDHGFGYRPFKDVVDGLKREGLLEVITGYKETTNSYDKGVATRFRATGKLIALAEDHGIPLSDWASHFTIIPRPTVIRAAVQLRADSWTNKNGEKYRGGAMDYDVSNPVVMRHAQQVHDINTFFAEQDIQPAEWHFAFTRIFAQGDHPDFAWNKGARLYSYGFGKSYQQVKRAERRSMTINGESVVEVDIQASYLTILRQNLGLPSLEGDPYNIPGVPRLVVKMWVTITLGNDGFHRRWPDASKERYADSDEFEGRNLQDDFPFRKTQAKILEHLSYLKDWPDCPVRWGDLQFLESSAVVDAVHRLAMQHGVPALPLHDALIVPQSKVAIAKQVLSDCFCHHVGSLPGITVKGAALRTAA